MLAARVRLFCRMARRPGEGRTHNHRCFLFAGGVYLYRFVDRPRRMGPGLRRDDVGRERVFAISRRDFTRVLQIVCASSEKRARGCRVRAAPAVSCAKNCAVGAHEHTGSAETLRHPPRNGFTAYGVISPATNSFLSPSLPA